MALSPEQRIGEIVALRTKLKVNPSLRNEINNSIGEILKKQGISLDPDLRPDLIFAIPEEVADALADVILPGGTNC
ncbi:hypothetical protein [Sinorhizobium meliloti]|uniref:hypothetical protein n=1 Tax=Rhizobium meliloti TaxID=382 RepID=UPI000FD81558|nr:hypothetical protein [Sinorhizobium meliloti]RVE88357.1 hypothetical protein CN238_16070 [Sinorhizobium meliloti]RVH28903.1 hypothetical protein CN214_17200 [Sinorhizobium meliloti]